MRKKAKMWKIESVGFLSFLEIVLILELLSVQQTIALKASGLNVDDVENQLQHVHLTKDPEYDSSNRYKMRDTPADNENINRRQGPAAYANILRRSIRSTTEEDYLHEVITTLEIFENSATCEREFLRVSNVPNNESVLKNIVDFSSLRGNSSIAIYTANLLSNSLGFNRSHIPQSVYEDPELYFSLVRTNVNTNPSLFGSCVAFDKYRFSGALLFGPCAHLSLDSQDITYELDMAAELDYTSDDKPVTNWFTKFSSSNPHKTSKSDLLQRRYNATYYQEKIFIQHAFVTEDDGTWTEPYFDCNVTNEWIITYSVPFFDASLQFQ